MILESRASRCYDRYRGRYVSCSSKWNDWGRWAMLAVIIVCSIIIFYVLARANSRKRRRQGLQPFMGTGWTTHNQHQNQNNQPPPNQPPPAYTPNQGYYGENAGYYGQQNPPYYGQPGPQQQQGVELQPPQNAYRGDNNIYPAPTSPPPPHLSKQ